MRISLNWLKKYVKIPVSDEELIRLIGARLVEVEGVIDETHKYDKIYVVRVVSAEKIPETHLTLCQIDVGGITSTGDAPAGGPPNQRIRGKAGEAGPVEHLVQVVCGASNVREGMLAAWIAPGAVVPASVNEDAPFVIGKRKMRGYESCGMLAGADELDFGDDHSGIVEIDPEVAKPGDSLAEVFELEDLILEIENKSLTHRPDCFGIIGFAREVAGILGEKFNENEIKNNLEINNNIKIEIENKEICSRYSALILEKHGEMKKKYLTWEDTVLSKSGMRPIDPIVDATNYLMLLTGQPLHAFDYDKFVAVGGTEKAEIKVRLARAGEKLELLDGKEVELNEDDIVICSGGTPVALAGAMGGKATEIDEGTRNILIEAATFSLYNLRKTQMAHGIFSEAITRFTKGQPPYQTLAVAEACAEMLSSGFRVAGVVDEYPKPEKPVVVKITTTEINSLLGTNYDKELIVRTLENVGFRVTSTGDAPAGGPPNQRIWGKAGEAGPVELTIESPEWRTDIHIKEDIIEEVGRLLGYDNIEPTLPKHGTAERNEMFELKRKVRGLMEKYGANEVLTYSFVSKRLLEKAGLDVKNSYRIVNSISPELQYVRQSIVPSLLEKAYLNEKLPVEKFAIYEMNKVYQKEEWGLDAEKVPVEKTRLGMVVAERKGTGTAFYKAKKYVAKLLEELNISAEFLLLEKNGAPARPFEKKRAAEIVVDGESVGVVGEFKNSVRNEFKLAPYLAGFEIDLESLMKQMSHKKQIEVQKRKTEDLTVTTEKSYAETLKEVAEKYPGAKITPGTIYQAENQKNRNITFHIEF